RPSARIAAPTLRLHALSKLTLHGYLSPQSWIRQRFPIETLDRLLPIGRMRALAVPRSPCDPGTPPHPRPTAERAATTGSGPDRYHTGSDTAGGAGPGRDATGAAHSRRTTVQ